MRTTLWIALASAAISAPAGAQLYRVEELTIAGIHSGLESGRFTCRELTQKYLERIEAYDQKGPALNAIVLVNPKALERAEELDREFARDGITRPLQCVPMIVKDNYDTFDLPTTAGSLSLAGSIPPDDAFQVRRIREAGAIVLAKSNMAEFAFTPYETLSSIRPGHTRHPYDLNRVPAGSSGGTAAAVAASFGAVGLGTDTGNSIRGPSSHTALVGIRSTMGLTSRDGIVPLNLYNDIGGPMARTVVDAVAVFDVIAGYDPNDPVTELARGRRPQSYLSSLTRDGLRGARLGVVRQLSNPETADPEILALFETALEDLRRRGAVLVDPVRIEGLDSKESLWCNPFKSQLEDYLRSLGPSAPVKSLKEIVDSEKYHPSIAARLSEALAIEIPPEEECRAAKEAMSRLRNEVESLFEGGRLSALVYPTWSNPPRLLGDLTSPHGNNSPRLSPPTGFPAVTVPMGFTRSNLPAGLQILGNAFSEETLFRIAYAYEQSTLHRRPPDSTPPLW
jgi:Asp-tRNA(Asn)/Glu-tRNA(Gln) amidotransferase A subunit family amidase